MILDYDTFAQEWEANWNSHDLDRIMGHYSDDIVFRSRKAFAHLGLGELRGKNQLRDYWFAALKSQPDLRFEVQNVLGGHNMAVIIYLNHRKVLAAETVYFDETGMVVLASACHDSWVDPDPYRIVVNLWVVAGQEAAYASFERKAFAAMSSYGGTVIEVTTPETGPTERHVLQFPTRRAFEAYRAGPEAVSLQVERELCIERTEIAEVSLDPSEPKQ